jgi:hypothetical protein
MKKYKVLNSAIAVIFVSLLLMQISCDNSVIPFEPPVVENLPMWSQHGFNARRTGNPYAPNPYIAPVNGISVNWLDTLEQGNMYVYPTIDSKGNIYYLHMLTDMISGILYKINSEGKILWKFRDSSWVISTDCGLGLSSDERNIYIPCYSGLYCVDSSGSLKWKYQAYAIYSNITMPAIGKDGTIYTVIGPYNLCAFTPDGTLKWVVPNAIGAPSLDKDENIYVGWTDMQPNGNRGLAKYNKDGSLKWKYSLRKPPFGCSIDVNNNIYCEFGLGNFQEGIVSLDKEGNLRWSKLLQFGDSIAITYFCTPLIDRENNIYASGLWISNNQKKVGIVKMDSSGNIISKFATQGNDQDYVPQSIFSDSQDNIYYTTNLDYGSFTKEGIIRFYEIKFLRFLLLSINYNAVAGIQNNTQNTLFSFK